jgi:para-nitrobenzyl esterase
VRQSYRPNGDYYYLPDTYYQNAAEGMPSDVPLMAGVTSGDGANHRLSLPVWLTQRTPTYESQQFIYKFSRVPDGWADMGLLSCHGCELPYLFNHPLGMVQNFQLGLVTTPAGERPTIGDINGNGTTGSQGDRDDIFLSMDYGPVDDSVAQNMMKMWANFAKTGNPSTEAFDWPVFTVENDTFVEIETDGEAVVKTGLNAAVRN